MNFAWIHEDIKNNTHLNFARNITEYITVELISKGNNVYYCYSEEEAKKYDVYAKIGTLYSHKIYTNDIKIKNINESDMVFFTYDKLVEKISFINSLLNSQRHFIGNTENLNDFCNLDKKYNIIVCTAGGVTPLKIPADFHIDKDTTIVVADYSLISLNMSKKIIEEWDTKEDLNQFVNKHKLIDNDILYFGKHDYHGKLKKHSKYKFVYVDLFDIDSVKKCLNSLEGTNGLWLASNIFNYITTSMLYDVQLRHEIQQQFINLLANDKINWDIGLNTAGSGAFKNESAKTLSDIKIYEGLKVLPWVKF